MNLKLSKIVVCLLVLFISSECFSDSDTKPGAARRRYSGICPPGTEQVGDGPPKSSLIFCRQSLKAGYRLQGDYISFYRNGNKKTEGNYSLGKKNGTWTNYKSSGEVVGTNEYKEGKLVRKPIQRNLKTPNQSQYRKYPDDNEVLAKFNETKVQRTNTKSNRLVYGIGGR